MTEVKMDEVNIVEKKPVSAKVSEVRAQDESSSSWGGPESNNEKRDEDDSIMDK